MAMGPNIFFSRPLLSKCVSTLLIALNLILETETPSDSQFLAFANFLAFTFCQVLCLSLAGRAGGENTAKLIRMSEYCKHFLTEYSTEMLCVRFGPGQQFNSTEWKD